MAIDELRTRALQVIEATRWKRKHIAKEIGVSHITLSRALNATGSTGEKTLIRVINRFDEEGTVKKETRYVFTKKKRVSK